MVVTAVAGGIASVSGGHRVPRRRPGRRWFAQLRAAVRPAVSPMPVGSQWQRRLRRPCRHWSGHCRMHATAARDPCRAGAAALRGRSLYPDGEAVAAHRQPRRAGHLATLHLSARYANVGGHGSFARNSMRPIVATERPPECRGFGCRASFRRCASAAVAWRRLGV